MSVERQIWLTSTLWDILKNGLRFFTFWLQWCASNLFLKVFSGNVLFSFDNFKTTGRMTLLFFLWESPESGEWFTYPSQVFEIGFGISTARRCWWVGQKSIKSQKFSELPDLLFKFFFRIYLLFFDINFSELHVAWLSFLLLERPESVKCFTYRVHACEIDFDVSTAHRS